MQPDAAQAKDDRDDPPAGAPKVSPSTPAISRKSSKKKGKDKVEMVTIKRDNPPMKRDNENIHE